MEITPVGIAVLVTVATVTLLRPAALPFLFAFLAPFSGVAVANVTSAGLDYARHVQPWLPVSVAMILRVGFEATLSGRVRVPLQGRGVATALLFWAGAVAGSAIGAGSARGLTFNDVDPACGCALLVERDGGWSVRTFTQAAYVVLGALGTVAGAKYLGSASVASILRIYVVGTLTMAALALVQATLSMVGVRFPVWLISNSGNPFAQGWMQETDIAGFRRISVGAAEPSLFAQGLGIALGIALTGPGAAGMKQPWLTAAVTLLILALLVSTATTAYVILALVGFGWVCRGLLARAMSRGLVAAVGLALAVATTGLGLAPTGRELVIHIVRAYLVEKPTSASWGDRLLSVQMGVEAWLQRPLIGWGPGALTARSLPVWLLANTGVFGFLAFTLVVGALIAWAISRKRVRSLAAREEARGVIWAVTVLLITDGLTGASFPFGFFWVPWLAAQAGSHSLSRMDRV